MGYEILNEGNGVQPYDINFNLICAPINGICTGSDNSCGGKNKSCEQFCTNPGLGCRNGCGGATGSSCVGTQSI
ncbi:MAG: hypothetical protein RR063_10150 [Anaerovoracaceae bacterium]